ncbi:lysophospholipid acyltransferase family protein [Pelosinus propionicus]|uniref:KDO2-lipid IV(A) lauroyltransferase n=1 Tax=Pelosinus propionicus DSM 13327 TaxID=1123291 RepID=A0A1I4PK87_9FIRM|nr:lysophospholipid acyltransferase family protein [Pelosinus propionicus]SFM28229.1 KDO2-lipid IV(A) lauroyltransferase [Pelosinus propionicus DSM 13327]
MNSLAMFISRIFLIFPNNIQSLIAKLVGLAVWAVVSRRRKNIMLKNIREIFHTTESEAYLIGKASITRFGGMLADLLQYPRLSKENIAEMVSFQGLEHLKGALDCGKGAVMVTGHCGNWELLGAALSYQGFPMVGVTRRQRNLSFNRFINVFRKMLPGATVLDKGNLRDVFRALNENKIPLIFIDVDGRETGVFVKFFDRWTSTPPGAAVLARMRGCPIIPAFISKASNGKHNIILQTPIWVDNSVNKETAIYDTMQHLSSILEQHIRRLPHEWFWLQDRWRTEKNE